MSSQPRSRRPHRQRRGATLVIVALCAAILMMFAGLSVDGARMYLYKAQLAGLADAAALSVSTDLRFARSRAYAVSRAQALRAGHQLRDGRLAVLGSAQVEEGQWDFDTGRFTRVTWAQATAVRVRPSYTAQWTLARIFGVATKTLTGTAIASLSAVGSSSCLAPFAMPYGALLQQVRRPPSRLDYDLAPADLPALRTVVAAQSFAETAADATTPGTFALVVLAGAPGSDAELATALRPGCGKDEVTVGGELQQFTGSLTTAAVISAFDQLCPGPTAIADRSCLRPVPLEVPVFDDAQPAGGGRVLRVRYIGAFVLTRIAFDGVNNRIFGYFSMKASSGAGTVLPNVGPVFSTALVQ